MNHDLFKNDNDFFECRICKRIYKFAPKVECQGFPTYEWGQAPENLFTKNQLAKKRVNPGEMPRGMVGKWLLYDLAEAKPFTDEQLAELRAKQRAASHKVCRRCKRTVSRKKWDRTYGMCDDCVPEYEREKFELEERLRREADEELAQDQAVRRDKSILRCREILAEGHALILDTETTGLGWGAEIVSIGIVDLNGKTVLQSLIKPSKSIPADATRIHGITDEMVKDAPGFGWIYSQLINLLPGRMVICYNIDFDGQMLSYEMGKLGILSNELQLLLNSACAMLIYADWYGEWSDYWGNNKWQPLPEGDHSAVGDCLATLKLIKKMAASKLSSEEISNENRVLKIPMNEVTI